MERYATPRLAGSLAIAGATLVGALLTGRLESLALGVPFLVAVAAAALESRGSTPPQVAVTVDPTRCLEGDAVSATVSVVSDEAAPDVLVGLRLPAGSRAPDGPVAALALPAGEAATARIGFAAGRWGMHAFGRVPVRVYGRGRLFYWETRVETPAELRVYPKFEATRRGAAPPRLQAYAGNYVSRAAGEGIEFAEVRGFAPGDRVRRINWRVSSRRGELYVNVAHHERNADVVVLVDTFERIGVPGRTSLDLAVRAAAALARRYLGHRDRVGLVTFGGMVHWLAVTGGNRQLERIVDYLLRVEATASYAWKDVDTLPAKTLPPHALVVALTPLVDARVLFALRDLRGRGFPVVVVDTLAEQEVPAGPSAEDRVAHRVWRLHREAVRAELAAHGVAVARWDGREDLDAVLLRLPLKHGRVGA
jgi:uncharacterized protein (DUF58 family)